MIGYELLPWMLRADWRESRQPLLIVDLASWPADLPFDPLPPIPVLAVGSATHPQAGSADVLPDTNIPLALLVPAIEAAPRASAALVQLLRSIAGLPADRALPLESFAFAMLQAGTEHAAWLASRPPAPASSPGVLDVRRRGDRLALLIDRPQARNAIDCVMRDALYDAASLAALDPSIARVSLRASGRCFSIGADLAEFGATRAVDAAHAIRARTLPAHPIARRADIWNIHVQGACVGSGLELAAWAGRLTAAPNAWFQLPETAMGILPGFGGCVSIPRRVGRQRAAALMLSGKRIGAGLAREWGLVDAIVAEPATA